MTHQLLSDIRQTCGSSVHEVVLFDNGSTDKDIPSAVMFWKNIYPQIVFHRIEENVGFLLGANQAIKSATGDIVVLLSNDVRIYNQDFMHDVYTIFSENEKPIVGGVLYSGDTGWNKFGDTIFPYIEGWMIAAKKEAWEELGYFDERYAPSDFEDVDFSTKALKAGYSLFTVSPGSVKHLGGKTYGYNQERESRTKKNRETFAKTWL